MANHFPVVPSGWSTVHIQYTIGQAPYATMQNYFGNPDVSNNAALGAPVQLDFYFSSGTSGSDNTFDYSHFDQDTVEAAVNTAAEAMATMIEQVTGLDSATVKGSLLVQRTIYMQPAAISDSVNWQELSTVVTTLPLS